jgi:molecular chaperone DnaK
MAPMPTKPAEATRVAPMPTPRAAVNEEPTRIAAAPTKSRGNTSPLGAPAARVPPPLDDLEDEATRIGPRPASLASPAPELSTPFVEVPSSVAVIPSRAIGVAAPVPREPVRPSPAFMDLDPVESLPPMERPGHAGHSGQQRPPREPTMQIGTGRDAVAKPMPAVAPPTSTGPVRGPTGAGGPTRAPTGTWALSTQDVPPAPPGRAQPPPPPPPRPPDKEKIQQALFGGTPRPFAAAAPAADPASSPGMSWSDFAVSIPPPASAPLSPGFGPSNALPVPSASPSPQAVAPRAPVVAMPDRPAPLLMDVTPLSLGLETVGGFVQQLVARNAPIPTEKTRVFSTGKDEQTEVEVRICQGDSNVFTQNQPLGAVSLTQLRKARRGEVRIEVTFMIDASGILDVKATDLDTKRVQAIRIALKGGASDAEVEAMRQRQAQLFPNG